MLPTQEPNNGIKKSETENPDPKKQAPDEQDTNREPEPAPEYADLQDYTDIEEVLLIDKEEFELDLWPTQHHYTMFYVKNLLELYVKVSVEVRADEEGDDECFKVGFLKSKATKNRLELEANGGVSNKLFLHVYNLDNVHAPPYKGIMVVKVGNKFEKRIPISVKVRRSSQVFWLFLR